MFKMLARLWVDLRASKAGIRAMEQVGKDGTAQERKDSVMLAG